VGKSRHKCLYSDATVRRAMVLRMCKAGSANFWSSRCDRRAIPKKVSVYEAAFAEAASCGASMPWRVRDVARQARPRGGSGPIGALTSPRAPPPPPGAG